MTLTHCEFESNSRTVGKLPVCPQVSPSSLTAYQARVLLGFQTRLEFEGFLKERGIYDYAYDSADLERDVENLSRVLGKSESD